MTPLIKHPVTLSCIIGISGMLFFYKEGISSGSRMAVVLLFKQLVVLFESPNKGISDVLIFPAQG